MQNDNAKRPSHHPLRVLMELRPCQEGFAGIPQETRLLFSAFQNLPNVKTAGLLNHPIHALTRSLSHGDVFDAATVHRKYDRLSRFVVSQRGPILAKGVVTRAITTIRRELTPTALALSASVGVQLPLYEFDAEQFKDFIWETLFAKSLPTEDYPKVTKADYRSLRTSWRTLHRTGLRGLAGFRQGHYPKLNTRGFDAFIAQTPCPAEVTTGTQLVVRYHDAIPIFLPHLIPDTRFHRNSHYRALLANARHAIFACTSAAVRDDVLRLLPALERRTIVLPDIVSHHYYPEPAPDEAVAEIIRSRLNPNTLPKSLSNRDRSHLLRKDILSGKLRYLMMVSTIEPRKNHVRLVRAWEQLRGGEAKGLKLIIVGDLGWDVDRIVDAFRPWQERSELLHLARVPAADLRRLYSSAECVICPSVAEGFDLSGIEAMLCGAPVIASDIPVHREIYAAAADYFDTYSEDSLAEQLNRLLIPNSARRIELAATGSHHAQIYRREAIVPRWDALFDRIRAGEFGVA